MTKRVAVMGDVTTTGGKIISGTDSSFCNTEQIAQLNDQVFCPKCHSLDVLFKLQII